MNKRKHRDAARQPPEGTALPPLLERPVVVSELFERDGETIVIEADERERAAIVREFGLEALLSLRASLVPRREGKVLHIAGVVKATLVQICGATLEPFENKVEEPVDMRFADDPKSGAARALAAPGNEAEWDDPPDPLPAGNLDLGAIVVEHLALGIDPYPRSPDADFHAEFGADETAEDAPDSPFEALRALRGEQKN